MANHTFGLSTILVSALVAMTISARGQDERKDIRVTGEVKRILLCDQDDAVNNLYFELELTLENQGKGPIIFLKGSLNITYFRVAASIEMLESTGSSHIFWLKFSPDEVELLDSPTDDYCVLQEGGSLQIPSRGRPLIVKEV